MAKNIQITIYATPSCPWCHKARDLLKQKKVAYKEVDVSSDEKGATEMFEKSGQMGVPVLDINGKIIVGFDRQAIEEELAE
ncbi:putative Thioredoxin [uncultured archaeon]|nr:putative Thioredoxin [uncultured archaeon]